MRPKTVDKYEYPKCSRDFCPKSWEEIMLSKEKSPPLFIQCYAFLAPCKFCRVKGRKAHWKELIRKLGPTVAFLLPF